MNVFHCDHCNQPVFFENTKCVKCDHLLAYLPDFREIGSLEPVDGFYLKSPRTTAEGKRYRLCRNYTESAVCNWALTESDGSNELCRSCRLTRVIPDLGPEGRRDAWYKLEVAKRRLLYTLIRLDLPVVEKSAHSSDGLVFEFLADSSDAVAPRVLTGHQDGVISIDIAEANDALREQRRSSLHEPYRTLLGHFRHESGHYYWDRLIRDSDRVEAFRELFGDERRDYSEALQAHYQQWAPADWQQHCVSAYSSSHPWEDWAETWAHYLHIDDTLETAAACGLSLRPRGSDDPSLVNIVETQSDTPESFDRMIRNWFPVTYILNNLNRGMGLPDGYPFVLSDHVLNKLRFVHDTIIQGDRHRVRTASAVQASVI